MRMKKEVALIAISIACFVIGVVLGNVITKLSIPKQEKIVVIDDLGRKVVLEGYPDKIVSMAAAATRTLYDLGVFDKVVGVDRYSDDPPEAQNKTIVDPKNTEGILSLNPDLVIAWWYYKSYLEPVEETGIPIIYIHPRNIDGILDDIVLIGKAVGAEDKAYNLVMDIKSKLYYIEQLVKNLTKQYGRPKVYLELYTPYKTVGRNTFTHDMIEFAGGINIAGNLTGYPKLSDEYIIKANPDVILYESSELKPEDFTSRPGWSNITAIRENRIYYLDRHIATASPRFVEGLKFMVEAFFNVSVVFKTKCEHPPSKHLNIVVVHKIKSTRFQTKLSPLCILAISGFRNLIVNKKHNLSAKSYSDGY